MWLAGTIALGLQSYLHGSWPPTFHTTKGLHSLKSKTNQSSLLALKALTFTVLYHRSWHNSHLGEEFLGMWATQFKTPCSTHPLNLPPWVGCGSPSLGKRHAQQEFWWDLLTLVFTFCPSCFTNGECGRRHEGVRNRWHQHLELFCLNPCWSPWLLSSPIVLIRVGST